MNTNTQITKAEVRVDVWTFDVGDAGDSVQSYVDTFVKLVEKSLGDEADIVLLPEYTWAGMEPFLPVGSGMAGVAKVFWDQVMPELEQRLQSQNKVIVLGSAPWLDPNSGKLHNRAPVLCDGKVIHQDKLFLTPWESEFRSGEHLHIFSAMGLRIAVLICLDIEVPELSVLLRGQNIDLILVPSATETLFGSERVTRCASARSVELCCGVVVSPLVGKCHSKMVNENVGRLACYLPSQSAFSTEKRISVSGLHDDGFKRSINIIPVTDLRTMRGRQFETNPAQIIKSLASRAISLEHYA